MTKNPLNQNDKYVQKFLDTIEPNLFLKITQLIDLKIIENDNKKDNQNKLKELSDLRKQINSIENCKFKN